eukprot:TRINITY_DN3512_c0_g1_i4.p1 TRINITY_DN3512_c0_g1~~TRINITY_DN3512_c0_g1_i4.p1  ORF type:complete len:221 (-),score=30.26 TRINITY_DN3512_c0_g1_i4:39-701(-)
MPWLAPLAVLILFSVEATTQEGNFFECWFRGEANVTSGLYLGCVLATLLYISIASILLLRTHSIYHRLAGIVNEDDRRWFAAVKYRGIAYLVAFCCCWVWYVAYCVMVLSGLTGDDAKIDEADGAVWYVTTIGAATATPLTGFVNALVWKWDPVVHTERFMNTIASVRAQRFAGLKLSRTTSTQKQQPAAQKTDQWGPPDELFVAEDEDEDEEQPILTKA